MNKIDLSLGRAHHKVHIYIYIHGRSQGGLRSLIIDNLTKIAMNR